MGILTRTIEGSWLYRPWVWLALWGEKHEEKQGEKQTASINTVRSDSEDLLKALPEPGKSLQKNASPEHSSCLLQAFSRLAKPVQQGLEVLRQAPWLCLAVSMLLNPVTLGLGLAGLLGLLSVAETGLIGKAVWMLLAMAGLLLLWNRRPLFKHANIVDGLVLAFFASAAISTAFSSYQPSSLYGISKMLTFLAGYGLFRLALVHSGRGMLLWLLAILSLLGLTQALIGFYQYTHHIQPLATWIDPSVNPELQMTRIFGTLKPSNPNLLAGFLLPGLAASWGLALLCQLSEQLRPFIPQSRLRLTLAVGFWLISLAILGALVLTGSRGGLLAIAGMGLTLFLLTGHLLWHDSRLKTRAGLKLLWLTVMVLGILGIAGVFIKAPQLQQRVLSIFAMRGDSSISYRLNVYHSAWQMFVDNPLLGIGPGNETFKRVYGLYMVPGFNALGSYSVPLEIAVEQGVLGLGIFILLLSTLKLRTYWLVDHDRRPLEAKLLALTSWLIIVGLFLYGFFDTIWYRPSVNLVFWLAVASLATLSQRLLQPSEQLPEPPKRMAVLNFGGLGDEILFAPVLKTLAERFPDTHRTLILEDRSAAVVPLLPGSPGLSATQTLAVQGISRLAVLSRLLRLLRQKASTDASVSSENTSCQNISLAGYQAVLSSGSSPFIAVLLFLSGIPVRIGFQTGPVSQLCLTQAAPLQLKQYAARMYFTLAQSFLAAYGQPAAEDPVFGLKSSQGALPDTLQHILKQAQGPKILLHPGVSQVSIQKNILKSWPAHHWAQLIEQLIAYANTDESGTHAHKPSVILTGGPDDAAIVAEILAQLPESLKNNVDPETFYNATGQTRSFTDLARLIQACDILVSVDSAPMHLAVAYNKPVVAMFGPTDENKLLPPETASALSVIRPDVPCRPCLWDHRQTSCQDPVCLAVPVKAMFEAIVQTVFRQQSQLS